jgi:hypothetical protein
MPHPFPTEGLTEMGSFPDREWVRFDEASGFVPLGDPVRVRGMGLFISREWGPIRRDRARILP